MGAESDSECVVRPRRLLYRAWVPRPFKGGGRISISSVIRVRVRPPRLKARGTQLGTPVPPDVPLFVAGRYVTLVRS